MQSLFKQSLSRNSVQAFFVHSEKGSFRILWGQGQKRETLAGLHSLYASLEKSLTSKRGQRLDGNPDNPHL